MSELELSCQLLKALLKNPYAVERKLRSEKETTERMKKLWLEWSLRSTQKDKLLRLAKNK
jgi:hypothetical protein